MNNALRIDFQEGDLTSLHPHDLIIYLRGISIGKTLFEGLTRIDDQGKPQLAGAKSVDVSLNGLFYVFKLRENRWSDGTPVTAFQYEAAWKDALSPVSFCKRPDLLYMIKNAQEAKTSAAAIDSIGVKALDEQTLLVELARPSPHFLELLAQPICAPLKDINEKTITYFNGPYQVDKWERGSILSLKPNPHFWNHKKVSIPQIEVYMVQDSATTFALFENKKIDWIGVPLGPLSTEQILHLKANKNLDSHPVERAFWVYLNTKHKALSSPSIRKALSLAINREKIINNIFIGGVPLDKPFPHELLPNPTPPLIQEDLAQAKKCFEEGLKELGLSRETFPKLSISYSQQHANRKQFSEYLQQAWSQAFGIKVELLQQEWNVLRTNLAAGDFEICGTSEASYYHDPLELMERMVSLSSSNFPQWIFPSFQQKIALASKEANLEQRNHLLNEAENILSEQMPFIPISRDGFLFSHNPKLKGYTFDSVGAIDFSYSTLK